MFTVFPLNRNPCLTRLLTQQCWVQNRIFLFNKNSVEGTKRKCTVCSREGLDCCYRLAAWIIIKTSVITFSFKEHDKLGLWVILEAKDGKEEEEEEGGKSLPFNVLGRFSQAISLLNPLADAAVPIQACGLIFVEMISYLFIQQGQICFGWLQQKWVCGAGGG